MPGVTGDSTHGTAELRPRFRLAMGDYVSALEVARDGGVCIAGLGDGRVVGFELTTGEESFAIAAAHAGGVLGVSISPDGRCFATCGQDAVAKVWSAEGSLLGELPGGGGAWVEHVAWAPVGSRIATASGKKLCVWMPEGERLVETEPLASTVTALAWRSDGSGLAATCYGGVHILPFVAGAKNRHLAWKGSLVSLAWSPDANVIACGSQDSSVLLWEPRKHGKPIGFAVLEDQVTGLCWHPGHHTLVGADASGTICGWEVA